MTRVSSTPPAQHSHLASPHPVAGRHGPTRPSRLSGLVPVGRAGRIAVFLLVLAAVATAIGVAALWPSYDEPRLDPTYAQSAGT